MNGALRWLGACYAWVYQNACNESPNPLAQGAWQGAQKRKIEHRDGHPRK
jgi:hypothetical protein